MAGQKKGGVDGVPPTPWIFQRYNNSAVSLTIIWTFILTICHLSFICEGSCRWPMHQCLSSGYQLQASVTDRLQSQTGPFCPLWSCEEGFWVRKNPWEVGEDQLVKEAGHEEEAGNADRFWALQAQTGKAEGENMAVVFIFNCETFVWDSAMLANMYTMPVFTDNNCTVLETIKAPVIPSCFPLTTFFSPTAHAGYYLFRQNSLKFNTMQLFLVQNS